MPRTPDKLHFSRTIRKVAHHHEIVKVKQEISTFIFMSAMLPKLAHLSLRALLGLTRFGSAARTYISKP